MSPVRTRASAAVPPRPAALAAAALLASLGAVAPLAAQRPAATAAPARTAERLADVTPYGGVVLFGNYLDGPLGTNLRSRPAPIGGAQLSVRVAPGVALVGNVGYTRGDLEVGVPVLGGVRVGSSSSWLYDAAVELRLPTTATRAFAPFLQAGGGAITTRLASGPLNTTTTNAAFNVGGGLDVSLGSSMALRLQARDYVTRFASQEVAGVQARGDLSHNVAVSAGLRLAF